MHGADGTRVEVDAYAQRLLDVLGEDQVMAIARRSRWLRRARKVMPLMMVVAVLSTLGSGGAKWLADILRTFRKFTGVQLQYKPFHKQLAKAAFAEMFRMLLEATVQRMTQPVLHAVSPKLSAFRDIILHDGSSFALKDDLKATWPGRFTKISPAAVELHVTMSLLQDDVRIVALTADKEPERAYRPPAASLRERLFLGDRGYEERRFFHDVQDAGGSFIVRGTKNIRPTIRAAFDSTGKRVARLAGKTLRWDRLEAQTVDMDIEWRSGALVYRGRIVAIYKRGKRNQKTFVYLHTNLARDRFCAADVAGVYRLRWQVELLFKEFKSHANLHAFDTGKAAIAEVMIWASLLARFESPAAGLVQPIEDHLEGQARVADLAVVLGGLGFGEDPGGDRMRCGQRHHLIGEHVERHVVIFAAGHQQDVLGDQTTRRRRCGIHARP
jgi:hypothetical protein